MTSSRLTACPGTPNCVCSDAADPSHAVAPFHLAVPAADAWRAAAAAIGRMVRCRIVEDTGGYLRAECRSALFGFVDDLELELRPEAAVLAVRSGSRTGRYDFGVNRRRVERLRALLRGAGILT